MSSYSRYRDSVRDKIPTTTIYLDGSQLLSDPECEGVLHRWKQQGTEDEKTRTFKRRYHIVLFTTNRERNPLVDEVILVRNQLDKIQTISNHAQYAIFISKEYETLEMLNKHFQQRSPKLVLLGQRIKKPWLKSVDDWIDLESSH